VKHVKSLTTNTPRRCPGALRFALLCGVFLGGCSLLVDLPERSGGGATTTDAGLAFHADVGQEAGGNLPDAASAEDATSKRCVFTAGRFCEDFDNGSSFACSPVVDTGVTFKQVTGNAHSPSKYVSLSFSGATGDQAGYCAVPNNVLNRATKYRVSMAIRFDKQADATRRVLTIYPNQDESVRFVFRSDGTTVEGIADLTIVDGGTRYDPRAELKAPLGSYGLWHVIDVDVDHIAHTVVLSVDGAAKPVALFADTKLDAVANPIVRFGSDFTRGVSADNTIQIDTLVLEPR
jgi:hypothetical protein